MSGHMQCVLMATLISTSSFAFAGLNEGLLALDHGDHRAALKELLPLANQGIPLAQLRVAFICHEGKGIPRDMKESITWMQKAADQGLLAAQENLASEYFLRMNVEQDYPLAIKFYRLAAEQGSTQAQYALGSMYIAGYGVMRNVIASYKWCLLAASGIPAGEDRERIQGRCDLAKPRLSPSDIAQAQLSVSQFAPKPEITNDLAAKIYDACMQKEIVVAKAASAEYPVMQAYSVCSYFSEPCRYEPHKNACDAGWNKYLSSKH